MRLPPNLWRYAPLTASLELVDPPRLDEPWHGSDFTLADLLVGPTALGSGPARLLGVDPASGADGSQSAFVLELRPAAGAPQGRVIAWIETSTRHRCAVIGATRAMRWSRPFASTSCARSRAAGFPTAGR